MNHFSSPCSFAAGCTPIGALLPPTVCNEYYTFSLCIVDLTCRGPKLCRKYSTVRPKVCGHYFGSGVIFIVWEIGQTSCSKGTDKEMVQFGVEELGATALIMDTGIVFCVFDRDFRVIAAVRKFSFIIFIHYNYASYFPSLTASTSLLLFALLYTTLRSL